MICSILIYHIIIYTFLGVKLNDSEISLLLTAENETRTDLKTLHTNATNIISTVCENMISWRRIVTVSYLIPALGVVL